MLSLKFLKNTELLKCEAQRIAYIKIKQAKKAICEAKENTERD